MLSQGVARFRLDGVEADDVIATLALRGLQAGMLVDIASPDKVCNRSLGRLRVYSFHSDALDRILRLNLRASKVSETLQNKAARFDARTC